MSRVAYVDGRWRPIHVPAVKLDDRGYQFADGVYEVARASGELLPDLGRHLARLARSRAALGIPAPMSDAALSAVLRETLRRNGLRQALLYLQVNRGVAPRAHAWAAGLRPSLVVTARPLRLPSAAERDGGVAVVLRPDDRWARCDVKSISLLPNVLARQAAALEGAREAWLVDATGRITEGSSSNAWIVDPGGRIVTRPLESSILGGVTREVVLELAAAAGLEVTLRAFTPDEARAAREAFLTSTSSLVLPVTRIDGQPVANGYPGSITRRLAQLYQSREECR